MSGCKHPPTLVVRRIFPDSRLTCQQMVQHRGFSGWCGLPAPDFRCEGCDTNLCSKHAGPDETKEDPNA